MNLNRAINVQSDFTRRLQDLQARVERNHWTHAKYLDARTELFSELPKDTPRWLDSYLSGYCSCWFNSLYRRGQLVYGAWINGEFWGTHRDRDDYAEKNPKFTSWKDFGENAQQPQHYWADDVSRPW